MPGTRAGLQGEVLGGPQFTRTHTHNVNVFAYDIVHLSCGHMQMYVCSFCMCVCGRGCLQSPTAVQVGPLSPQEVPGPAPKGRLLPGRSPGGRRPQGRAGAALGPPEQGKNAARRLRDCLFGNDDLELESAVSVVPKKIWISIFGLRDEHWIPGRNAQCRHRISGRGAWGTQMYTNAYTHTRTLSENRIHTWECICT